MSGGAWEYVMAVMLDSTNTIPCSGRDANLNSGFNGPYCGIPLSLTNGIDFPIDSKYYDTYKYGTSDKRYDLRILGDATGEMGPFMSKNYIVSVTRQIGSWYDDEAWFVYTGWSWFSRGRAFIGGTGAGIFDFFNTFGHAVLNHTFRVVLSS